MPGRRLWLRRLKELPQSGADLEGAISSGLDNALAVVDFVTSQEAVSSDARKGRGFAPDDQPPTVWDEAERKRRENA